MDDKEVRAKALELTLQMFSIFVPGKVEETLENLAGGGAMNYKLLNAARVFELYIMDGDELSLRADSEKRRSK